LRFIADAGDDAATLFGIASEFYKLSDRERDRMVDVVTDVLGEEGVAAVISVTHESTVVAVEWAKQYEAAGADCIMVFPPRFGDPPTETIIDHLRQIGEAVAIPVMVQHTPMNAAVSPAEFAALHEEVPSVKYFKIEVSPPGPFISDLQEEIGESATTLVGSAGKQMIEAYDRDAVGVMPAAVWDELYNEIHDCYLRGDRERAVELHTELLGALSVFQGIPSSKYLLAERGIIETSRCRAPTAGLGDEVNETLLLEAHERIMRIIDSL
jgi:4-hydroxy-tetrahydrodipicolinate synthase